MSSGCPFCAHAQTVYLASDRWELLRHADPVPLAGWMMVASRRHLAGLDSMGADEQAELGRVLAEVARAVREVTGCARTYSISFNEAVPHLHLHVIPRHAHDETTKSWMLADRYRATARREVACADPADAERAAREVAAACAGPLADLGFRTPTGVPGPEAR